ncbi:hypothetical protein [Spirosoma endophyticum]|nr:hypothetical protein [Spirosoma endophyticum]
MRKTSVIALLSAMVLVGSLTGCKKTSTPPVSELIAKVWTATKVEEDNVTVYIKGGASNIRDYAKFKLDLSKPPAVSYTEYDGNTFVGQYAVPDDQTLSLTNLNPPPSDGPAVSFTINSIDDNNLVITRTKGSLKTGGKINKYTLTSQ